jgi:hypothetical protein
LAQCEEGGRSSGGPIASPLEAVGSIDQIAEGLQIGFHLEQNYAGKGNQTSQRAIRPDMFAILTPQAFW